MLYVYSGHPSSMRAGTSLSREACAGMIEDARHRPEHTLLYQIIERHYPAFLEQLSEAGRHLPRPCRECLLLEGRSGRTQK